MKIKGTFYLTNGSVHKETCKIPKKKKKEAIQIINTMINQIKDHPGENMPIQFGYFITSAENIVAVHFKD